MRQQGGRRLFSPRRRRHVGCLTVVLLLFAALALVLSLNGLSNRFVRLETRRVTVLNLPKTLEKFTVLHLSDLHGARLGNEQENLRKALDKESFQAVALTGDMVGRGGDTEPLMELLTLLPEGVPVFLIAGDGDPAPLLRTPHGDSEVKAEYIRRAEAMGAVYLEAPFRMTHEEQTVWFCPGDLFLYDLPSARNALAVQVETLRSSENAYDPEIGAQLRFAEHRLKVTEQALEATEAMKPGDVIIALMHHPPGPGILGELSLSSREGGKPSPSLFLAGGFNNGQIRLPGLGPVFIPRQGDGRGGLFPGDEGFTGLSIIKGFPLYISPGLGVSDYYPLPLRLFNRPGATLLELTAQMTR